MVVRVVDAAGNPLINTPVNWTILSGPSSSTLNGGDATLTDGDGVARNQLSYFGGLSPQGSQYNQSSVNASTSTSAATFTESAGIPSALTNTGGIIFPISALAPSYLQSLIAGEPVTGQAGTSSTTPIQWSISSSSGAAVPNVSVQLVNLQDPSSGPIAVCKESEGGPNVALTNSAGIATCTPQFSGTPGEGRFYLLLGAGGVPPDDLTSPPGLHTSPIKLVVTPAAVGTVAIISGNSQTGAPGQVLAPFTVEVDGTNGSPLSGQQVRWSASPASALASFSPVTTTDATGRTSLTGTFSATANGVVQVTATSVSDSTKFITFGVTAVPPVTITSFTLVSGNNQTASVGTAYSQPLVVKVSVSAGSASNLTVQFRVTSGSVILSSTTAATDANGQAQVTVTAGTVTGSASVEASIASSGGNGTQVFQLSVTPAAPNITAASFVNGADQQPNSLSPCSIGMILAPVGVLGIPNASPTFPGQPVTSIARITFNNVGAPILGISTTANNQQAISFQVPCETATGSASVGVNLGGATTTVTVTVQAASPGIYQTAGGDGVLRAVVIRPDGSFATVTNPSRKGERASVFVTGLGTTSPATGTYSLPVPGGAAANATGIVVAGISGGGAQVISAKLTEDLPGVFLLTFVVPDDAAVGSNVAISVAVIPQGSGTPIYSATTKIPIL